jgi:hypothetical protein
MACAVSWLCLFTLVLLASRFRFFGSRTISLWLQRLRHLPVPLAFLGPFLLMVRSLPSSIFRNGFFYLFAALLLLAMLGALRNVFRPIGGLSGLIRDLWKNHGQTLRASLPFPVAIDARHQPFAIPAKIQIQALHSRLELIRLRQSRTGFANNCIITRLDAADLERAAAWELDSIGEYLKWYWTNSTWPVFLVGDWEEHGIDTVRSVKGRAWLSQMRLYVDGFSCSPDKRSSILQLNSAVKVDGMLFRELEAILEQAYTPVARLMRTVFSSDNASERIRLCATAVETAFTYFAIATSLAKNSALPKQLQKKPSFTEWVQAVESAVQSPSDSLGQALAHCLGSPCNEDAARLSSMLEAIGHSEAGDSPRTITDSVHALIQIRNLTGVRGPLSQLPDEKLYAMVLTTTLHILASMPWTAVRTMLLAPSGEKSYFAVGTTTRLIEERLESRAILVFPAQSGDRKVDASKYFMPVVGFGSVALFAGGEALFDPVSGLHIPSR